MPFPLPQPLYTPRCVILQAALVRTALETAVREACGFISEIQRTIQRCYQDAIFIFSRDILLKALKKVYPDREDKKYKGLMATCFNYCYNDTLGKDLYQQIKKEKKSYPVHQYIQDEKTRQICVCYMNTLASQVAARSCRVAEARKYTQELLAEHLNS